MDGPPALGPGRAPVAQTDVGEGSPDHRSSAGPRSRRPSSWTGSSSCTATTTRSAPVAIPSGSGVQSDTGATPDGNQPSIAMPHPVAHSLPYDDTQQVPAVGPPAQYKSHLRPGFGHLRQANRQDHITCTVLGVNRPGSLLPGRSTTSEGTAHVQVSWKSRATAGAIALTGCEDSSPSSTVFGNQALEPKGIHRSFRSGGRVASGLRRRRHRIRQARPHASGRPANADRAYRDDREYGDHAPCTRQGMTRSPRCCPILLGDSRQCPRARVWKGSTSTPSRVTGTTDSS